ncbi:RHS repeat-associated core domain-containing protein [Xanthomonas cannabis]|uniref:RHS repeat-associated core domain-containing protein n=1 Tax=Xanthomonas cannabis TaxID=1885674 RepID=UPI0033B3B883
MVTQTGTHAPQTLPAASSGNTFDDNNRQTAANNVALSYDESVNLLSDGSRSYVWDDRDSLSQIQQGGTTIASFSYDALGRRIAKTEAGTSTQYLYDGLDTVQETQGTTVNPILTGLGIDQRYARNDTGGRTYFLTDQLGSTRLLTNAAGSAVQRYDYDPYGTTTQSSTAYTNPYQYTGREKDLNGLYYYRARYYRPQWGRFVSEDPIGLAGGINYYAYVGGVPLQYVDPDGLQRSSPSRFNIPGGGNSQQRRQWNRQQYNNVNNNSFSNPINDRGIAPEEIASKENVASLLSGNDYTQYCAEAICRKDNSQCTAGDINNNWIPSHPTVAQVQAMGCSCSAPYYSGAPPLQDPSAGYGDVLQLITDFLKRR